MYMIHRKGADRDEILIHLCVYELKELAKILVKKTRGGGTYVLMTFIYFKEDIS